MSDQSERPDFKVHCFICTNCTYMDDKMNPSPEGEAKTLRDNLKSRAKAIWGKDLVRINKSGCLGQCEKGISAVIYPNGTWLTGLRPGDEGRLLSAIEEILRSGTESSS